ncbi:hypothetical protein [Micromonospora endophytica]|uniref:hypothetical protein n=1 Tax=Micromonospora endophytica TaxID=515350 RepID=UPI0011B7E0D6|nr:hypothetical protein [Micromonospora endophytica]BCJ58161.1 hypothetical protein Jiend_15830 [Micromonospora endophytica]
MSDEEPENTSGALVRILQSAYPEVGSVDPVEYISELGDSVQALVYSMLFWPKLVEIEGAVFVALWGDDAQYISRRLRVPVSSSKWAPLSWSKFVDSFNIFEIAQIFRQNRGPAELVEDANRELALVLVRSWSARLSASFPERRFSVRLVASDEMMESRIEVVQEYPPLVPPSGWSSERRIIIASEGDPNGG